MDQKERDEILYRLDERTKKVDAHLRKLDERVTENEAVIDDLESDVRSNTESVRLIYRAGASVGSIVTAAIGALVAKVGGLL